MIEKLEQIDEILASYEDWMHGKDGENCTKARKLLIEATEEVKNISSKPVLCDSVCPKCEPMIKVDEKYNCEMCGYVDGQTDA